MKRVNLFAIIAVLIGLTSLSSCTNVSTPVAAASLTATASSVGKASSVNDLAVSYANVYLNSLALTKPFGSNGALYSGPQKAPLTQIIGGVTITIDSAGINAYPKKICIDFGTTGITLKHGNVLKGKIYITVTGEMSIANSSRTFTFSNFYVNDNAIKGTNVVTYMGLNTDSNPYWTISANDTIVHADGTQVIWNSTRTRTRINQNTSSLNKETDDNENSLDSIKNNSQDSINTENGNNVNSSDSIHNNYKHSLMYWVDTYSIFGTANGVNEKGEAYTMSIDAANPLIIGDGFPFFTKGKEIISSGNNTEVLDYGDGTKDSKVTTTLNGVSEDFDLNK